MKKTIFALSLLVGIFGAVVFSQLKPMPDAVLKEEKDANSQVLNTQPLPENTPITRLVVMKSKRQMWA